MGCQPSKPEDVQPPPTPPADADKAKSPPTPQAAPADVLEMVFEDAAPAPAPTPSGFARALGVAQDPASPPPAPTSTRGRSLSPSSSRGDLVEDGKTASPPSTPLPPRTDPPSPTSAGSLQAPAFCVDDDVTTPIKLPPQPEVRVQCINHDLHAINATPALRCVVPLPNYATELVRPCCRIEMTLWRVIGGTRLTG